MDARGRRSQESVVEALAVLGLDVSRQALSHWERNLGPAPTVAVGLLADVYGMGKDRRAALFDAAAVPHEARPKDLDRDEADPADGDVEQVAK